MDGDDISVKEEFEIQLKCFEDNPSINLVASNTIFFKDNKVIGVSDAKTNSPKSKFFLRPIGLQHVTWMVRKEFFKNFKYNPNIPTIDQDLLLRSYQSINYIFG